jgi:hypothetical protein
MLWSQELLGNPGGYTKRLEESANNWTLQGNFSLGPLTRRKPIPDGSPAEPTRAPMSNLVRRGWRMTINPHPSGPDPSSFRLGLSIDVGTW